MSDVKCFWIARTSLGPHVFKSRKEIAGFKRRLTKPTIDSISEYWSADESEAWAALNSNSEIGLSGFAGGQPVAKRDAKYFAQLRARIRGYRSQPHTPDRTFFMTPEQLAEYREKRTMPTSLKEVAKATTIKIVRKEVPETGSYDLTGLSLLEKRRIINKIQKLPPPAEKKLNPLVWEVLANGNVRFKNVEYHRTEAIPLFKIHYPLDFEDLMTQLNKL